MHFHRNILYRPRLRTITKINPVRLLRMLGRWEQRLKLLFRAGMIKSTEVLPITHWWGYNHGGMQK